MSSTITIRKISVQDLPQLANLYEKLIKHNSNLSKMREIFPFINANEHYHLLGAFNKDNELVGTAMGIICYDLCKECQPFMTGENLIIEDTWQGKGVGKLLFEKLEAIGREKNCIFLQFCSSSFREGAHRFYEAIGYDPKEVKGYRKYFSKKDRLTTD